MTLDIEALRAYPVQPAYRFRVYRVGERKGYLGSFGEEDPDQVVTMIRYDYGAGIYYLKLVDGEGRMTGHNFRIEFFGPPDGDARERLERLEAQRQDIRMMRTLTRTMRRNIDERRKKKAGEKDAQEKV